MRQAKHEAGLQDIQMITADSELEEDDSSDSDFVVPDEMPFHCAHNDETGGSATTPPVTQARSTTPTPSDVVTAQKRVLQLLLRL